MREVIRIDKKEENDKPVEFTHYLNEHEGWEKTTTKPSSFSKIAYLGHCPTDGDMFACYKHDFINIFKGHLNSGKYE